MKIGTDKLVSLTYELKVDGELVEKVTAEKPLQFIYGMGFLLPKFEESVKDKKSGDTFAFRIEPTEGYGEITSDAIVELPQEVFMIDGKIEEGLLTVGNQLPMSDNQGNSMMGTIKVIGDDTVTMDFNHPLAGKALEFSGEVVAVREATEEDKAAFLAPAAGGCDCGCNCNSDCDCSAEENCGHPKCNC